MDPWAEIGLDRDTATVDQVKAARRAWSKQLHPDAMVGAADDDRAAASDRLVRLNRAAELCLADLRTRGPAAGTGAAHVPMPPPGPVAAEWAPTEPEDATFAVELLPVEAFELVLLAFSAIGDPKVVDEPYLLEGQVDEPYLGHARVTLVPTGGGSLVTVETAAARPGFPPPPPTTVASKLLWEVKALRG